MLKFYTEVVGLKKVANAETPPEMSRLARSAPNGYRIVRMQTPNGERIKLIQPKAASPKRLQFLNGHSCEQESLSIRFLSTTWTRLSRS